MGGKDNDIDLARALRSPLNLSPNAPHIFYDVAVDGRHTLPSYPSSSSSSRRDPFKIRLVEHEDDHRRGNVASASVVFLFPL